MLALGCATAGLIITGPLAPAARPTVARFGKLCMEDSAWEQYKKERGEADFEQQEAEYRQVRTAASPQIS